MEKIKLNQLRQSKGISQEQMADKLAITASTYSRKESGQVRIRPEEWEKIAKFLEVPVEEVYEPEDSACFILRDQSTANHNYVGTNHVYSIPEYFLEMQRKYIEKLEKEITELKNQQKK